MVSIFSLWMPILLSAVIVFIASALVWMALPHHKKDYKQTPNEGAVRDALKGIAPGQYNIPHVANMEDLKKDEEKKKFEDGPVGFLTVLPNGIPAMGKNLALSFVYYLVVGIFIAYILGRTLSPDAGYMTVFRLASVTGFLAYGGLGMAQDANWFGRPWSAIIKNAFDALLYGLLTGGVFGWLWH